MRYSKDHKAITRDRLVRDSAAQAKKGGFAASGVDALARAAGLTSGAFYKHFGGKDALLSAICKTELEATTARFSSLDSRAQLLRAFDAYLSLAHVRSPSSGCVLPALSAEVGRAPRATREVYERAFAELVAVFVDKFGDTTTANALVTQCVGAVTIARALATEAAQQAVLAAAREGVRRLLAAAPMAS
jgi:TetR/AcrR family transcriptional repressor of nem operon